MHASTPTRWEERPPGLRWGGEDAGIGREGVAGGATGEESRRLVVRKHERREVRGWVRVRIRQRGKVAISRYSPIELNKILGAVSPSKES